MAPKLDEILDKNQNKKEKQAQEKRDVEPDENMRGYLKKTERQMVEDHAHEPGGANINMNVLGDVVGGLGDGLRYGAKMLQDQMGIAALSAPIVNLVVRQEYFALKNGVLYWYPSEKARRASGSIILKDVEALQINQRNRTQINLLYDGVRFTLETMNSLDLAEKWYNSLKLVKEMGDLQNLDPCRY